MMSYTRAAWKRKYAFGNSNLYSFIGSPDGNLWFLAHTNKEGFDYIEKEDAFEMVVNILRRSGIKLNELQMKKLAKELGVRLRKKPLSFEERLCDINNHSIRKKS